MRFFLLITLSLSCHFALFSQSLSSFRLDEVWLEKIESIAPNSSSSISQRKKNVLVFDLATGYKHWTIPHTTAVIELLGKKAEAYHTSVSQDIGVFQLDELRKFDALVLNNTCSQGDHRNLFFDILKDAHSEKEAWDKACELEQNILKFVKKGGGLVVLHGGITMLNDSQSFSELVGGSFDYHPVQQKIEAQVLDENHPITASFGNGPFISVDEPYFLKGAYSDLHFYPLLGFEPQKLSGVRDTSNSEMRYISWVKPYGKGRVFFSAPSHNAQTFEQSSFLHFLLNGIKYAIGDLSCTDTPIK